MGSKISILGYHKAHVRAFNSSFNWNCSIFVFTANIFFPLHKGEGILAPSASVFNLAPRSQPAAGGGGGIIKLKSKRAHLAFPRPPRCERGGKFHESILVSSGVVCIPLIFFLKTFSGKRKVGNLFRSGVSAHCAGFVLARLNLHAPPLPPSSFDSNNSHGSSSERIYGENRVGCRIRN